MSIASLVYLSITAATAGFTGCAFAVDLIDRKPIWRLWGIVCLTSVGACVLFIASKA